jgi:O-antigen ligase
VKLVATLSTERFQQALQGMLAALIALGVGLAMLRFDPVISLGVLGGVGLFVALLFRPEWGLYLLIVSVPLQGIRTLKVGPLNFSSTELLVILTSVAWLVRVAAQRTTRLRPAPLLVPLLALTATIFISFLQARELTLSLKELIKWLELLMVYLLAANLLTDRKQLRIVAALIIGMACIEACFGVFQFVSRRGPPSFLIQGRFMRAYGNFEQPNPMAGYLNLALPLTLALALVAVQRAWGNRNEARPSLSWSVALPRAASRAVVHEGSRALAVGLVAASGLLALVVGATLSRGAWIALLVAAFLLSLRARRTPWTLVAVMVCVLIFGAWCIAVGIVSTAIPTAILRSFSLTGVDTDVRHLTPQTFSAAQRLAYWIAGWRMFSDHVWLGVGMGNYSEYYQQYAVLGWEQQLAHAHDYYLNLAAETGLLGLAAFLWFTFAALFTTWRAAFRLADPFLGAIIAGAFGAMVTLSVHNVFDDLFVHGTVNLIAILLGAAVVAIRLDGCADHAEPWSASG